MTPLGGPGDRDDIRARIILGSYVIGHALMTPFYFFHNIFRTPLNVRITRSSTASWPRNTVFKDFKNFKGECMQYPSLYAEKCYILTHS